MKLKNILLAGLMVCSFVGCSKGNSDEQPEIPIDQLPDAQLSIQVKASKTTRNRAVDPEELPGEANINNLSAVVFNEKGDALLGAPVWKEIGTTDGTATLLDIPVKATLAKIVILANTPQNAFSNVTSFADFQQRLAELSAQKQDNLTMSSWVINTTRELNAGENYIGYTLVDNVNGINQPLELTRLAARLDLITVKTNFSNSPLRGRTVRVDRISVINQKTASRYFSSGYWGPVIVDGHYENSLLVESPINVAAGGIPTPVGTRHYVMENCTSQGTIQNPTELNITATLLATPEYGAITKTFVVAINTNGVANKYDHNYVKRNYVYRLNVTFSGSSFDITDPDPDPTPVPPETGSLIVQVEVVGWGPVNQHVEIE